MPATQPALPLPTMNAHCMAVRMAALDTNNPANLPPEVLDKLIAMAGVIQNDLREGYAAVRGDQGLRDRYETAGKAVLRLLYGLHGRRGA